MQHYAAKLAQGIFLPISSGIYQKQKLKQINSLTFHWNSMLNPVETEVVLDSEGMNES